MSSENDTLYWRVLKHVHGKDDWGKTAEDRADNIFNAQVTVRHMDNLEFLETLSAAYEKDQSR